MESAAASFPVYISIARIIAVTVCLTSLFLHRLLVWLRASSKAKKMKSSAHEDRAERERKAKNSFYVRRNDLGKIARGEPTGRKRRQATGRNRQEGNRQRKQSGANATESYTRRYDRSLDHRGEGADHTTTTSSWFSRYISLIWQGKGEDHGNRRRSSDRNVIRRPTAAAAAAAAVSDALSENDENDDDGLQNVAVMALDCEMVGSGRDGSISLLGRCSLVYLEQAGTNTDTTGGGETACVDTLQMRTVYDKFVRPSRTVTDYRTQWSGITKNDLKGLGNLPCVPFEVCRREVADLLASYEGKPVVLVGHALTNDFSVLNLRHPFGLTRDTATYRQFMRPGRTQNRLLQRKLSHLVEEELGMDIQKNSGGHSSVEDAVAALKLYWKVRQEWERSLGCPLRSFDSTRTGISGDNIALVQDYWPPVTLYIDGCNLPINIRKHEDGNGGAATSWQVISKKSTQGTTEVYRSIDWIPVFRSALASSSPPIFDKIVLMFDGAKYKNDKNQMVPSLEEISTNIVYEITNVGESVDDVLVDRCCTGISSTFAGAIVSIDDIISSFGDNVANMGFESIDTSANDLIDCYAVVRRKGGGTKTNKKLFDKLNLRRPEEGAHCLAGLTARLHKNSLQTAKDLRRARVYDLVEYELRSRAAVKNIIVTDDILLADRLVNSGRNGENLVLSWRQLQQMF